MIESCGLSDAGCVRAQNEDRVLADHSLGLFVVADGMGGHSHGEVAADLAMATLRYYLDSSSDPFDVTWPFGYNFDLSINANRLSTAIHLANRQVWNYAEQSPEYSGMGTTIAAILLLEKTAVIGNVGDSRVYLWQAGVLKQISYDDTFLNVMGERAGAAAGELANHPLRNLLTQAAGSRESLDIHIRELEVSSGDIFLLTSDGLHGVIGDEAMQAIVGSGDTLEISAKRLIEAARASGAPDNTSCVLVRYNL